MQYVNCEEFACWATFAWGLIVLWQIARWHLAYNDLPDFVALVFVALVSEAPPGNGMCEKNPSRTG